MLMLRALFAASLIMIPAGAADLFEFRNGFWENMHHYAYATAKEVDNRETILQPDSWRACVDYYRANLVKKDLLMDTDMMRYKLALSTGDLNALPEGHANILRAAAQAYREGAWSMHSRQNQSWIESMRPLVEAHGAKLAKRLSEFYGTAWPDKPVVVDLVPAATFAGAYTSVGPTHITIAAGETPNRGESGLEILFHEASHGLIRPLDILIDEELRRQNAYLPRRDLWHALLFFTTGEIVRRELGQDYTPYAYKGLWARAWPMYIASFEKLWIPVINGTVEKRPALEALIKEVKTERPPAKK